MGYFFSILLIAFILGVVVAALKWPIWVVFVIIILFSVLRFYRMYNIVYKSKNIEQMAKFFQANKRNPLYGYTASLQSMDNATIKAASERILAKYKQPELQAIHKTNIAILEKDYAKAQREIQPIAGTGQGQITLAQIHALRNKPLEIQKLSFDEPWAKAMVAAILALHKKDLTTFEEQRKIALDNSTGMQHFSNYYALEKLKKEMR